ncbi:BadF/BadG/BcrA/BcrD ATPase family protein [Carboxydochorda subterranea]|uniref:BadF/BadG/BcrA/BcrD ATPase family protein n=1 Tax=Carboxydichorda subterranea TaxID=3109565 RepID=A0ABZ1BZC8_9FIRM|nr:BadF/BadG/BcrA/BcrD ATPase family protein [Limnochorda sp. L945t]WRP17443.1 BadF/BadG/BcrA/BcrD ATPase family protein [Limnochorda sp. L945t]
MPEGYVLAVDGGGTKVMALVASTHGEVLSVARSGGVNPNFAPASETYAHLDDAVRLALGEAGIAADQVVAAGCSGPLDLGQLKTVLARAGFRGPSHHFSEPDVAMGLWPDEPEMAAVLVVGTGSLAWARGPEGKQVTVDGYGFPIGDDGSGADIGVRAIRAVLRAHDGRGDPTELVELFAARLGLHDIPAIVDAVHRGPLARRQSRSALVPLVAEAADHGDRVARLILDEAAAALADTVAAALRRAGLFERLVPVTCIGGVFKAGPSFGGALTRACEHRSLKVVLTLPTVLPIAGVVRRVLDAVASGAGVDALRALARDSRLDAGLPKRMLERLRAAGGWSWLVQGLQA